jgi:hypothetical protein
MGDASGQKQNPVLAGLVLLLMRGVLLWIVIPLAVVAWTPAAPWLVLRGVRLGHFLGWVDLNLIAFLSRIVLRPLFRAPAAWVPASAMNQVTHRISAFDLA